MIPEPDWLRRLPDSALRTTATAEFRARLSALVRGPREAVDPRHRIKTAFGDGRVKIPAWVTRHEDPPLARVNFLVRLAALYASRQGSLTRLAVLCGYNPRALSTYISLGCGRASISPVLARRIEAACGGVVKRADLNPAVFGD